MITNAVIYSAVVLSSCMRLSSAARIAVVKQDP